MGGSGALSEEKDLTEAVGFILKTCPNLVALCMSGRLSGDDLQGILDDFGRIAQAGALVGTEQWDRMEKAVKAAQANKN